MTDKNSLLVVYVVYREDTKQYFKGFDSISHTPTFSNDIKLAKKFSNKHDIKIRPNEQLVAITVDLDKVVFEVSKPFKPIRKK